jgi:ATP sulfurylase
MSARIGNIRLQFDEYILILRNVFYVPDLMINVISVEKLKVNNYINYTSWPHSLFNKETLQTFVIADSTRDIPTIDMNHLVKLNINTARTAIINPTINYNEAKDQEITLKLAYYRLDHILMP